MVSLVDESIVCQSVTANGHRSINESGQGFGATAGPLKSTDCLSAVFFIGLREMESFTVKGKSASTEGIAEAILVIKRPIKYSNTYAFY